MANWLLKTEPSEYSFQDLVRDEKTAWDGITNALALKHLRAMRKGDRLLIYHTGAERRVVGTATVSRAAPPDPDPKRVVVEIAAGKPLATPVTLDAIKRDPSLAQWDLLRIGRLSVVPTTDAQWDAVCGAG